MNDVLVHHEGPPGHWLAGRLAQDGAVSDAVGGGGGGDGHGHWVSCLLDQHYLSVSRILIIVGYSSAWSDYDLSSLRHIFVFFSYHVFCFYHSHGKICKFSQTKSFKSKRGIPSHLLLKPLLTLQQSVCQLYSDSTGQISDYFAVGSAQKSL